jgi:TIR domain.
VFVSHSSADKAFVRRLARRIQAERFGVWLDEHELIPGDRLSEKIAEALQDAKVVLVVVSKASVKSKWLAFELNLAAERMVKGTCRVIPVVIGDVEPPAAVQGLLFADFRRSFANGLKAILTALRYEAKQATRRAGFWAQAEDMVGKVFGGRGWVARLGEFDDRTHDIVSVPAGAEGDGTTEVVFDTVSDYLRKKKPVGEGWWSEFTEMRDDFDEDLFLVCQRPLGNVGI